MLPLTPPRPDATAPAAAPSRWQRLSRLAMPVEVLLLLAGTWFALLANQRFVMTALDEPDWTEASTWTYGAALVLGLLALHVLLVAPLANRWTVKPLLAVLFVASAAATFYMEQYGVFLDPSMLRNVLQTDWHEAGELLGSALLLHMLLYAGLPLLLLWRVRLVLWGWKRSVLTRLALIALCLGVLVAAVLSAFLPFSSLMRNNKELRYLITPANLAWSLATVVGADAKASALPRQPIGLDAKPGPSWATQQRPRLLVVVVGETARLANWGLSGYARQTTPRLAGMPVINFRQTQACGTNTATSLPCMFAPVGRRAYDESKIRSQQSLLHVLDRAGAGVTWRDNQSGCKGVCEGLPTQAVADINPPGLCQGRRCLDEGLLHGLPDMLKQLRGTQVLVLHQLGNHGPSYFRRYPPAFARFTPECRRDDLRRCTREQIVNSYDNALLYTDHVLAELIQALQARSGDVDSAVLYVSDHGESLGESNLYLHGLPYAIAPAEQKQVPMVMWFSDGFARTRGLDLACLRQHAAKPAAHDHLFHTVLGLLDVHTALYEGAWDLGLPCRRPPEQAG